MQIILLGILKKLAPYIVLFVSGAGAGLYVGLHFGAGALSAAKAALVQQQGDDAKAAAAANADAVAALVQANTVANAAEQALAEADQHSNAQAAALSSQIAVLASQPGQDAPDAPVLAQTLDSLRGNP